MSGDVAREGVSEGVTTVSPAAPAGRQGVSSGVDTQRPQQPREPALGHRPTVTPRRPGAMLQRNELREEVRRRDDVALVLGQELLDIPQQLDRRFGVLTGLATRQLDGRRAGPGWPLAAGRLSNR